MSDVSTNESEIPIVDENPVRNNDASKQDIYRPSDPDTKIDDWWVNRVGDENYFNRIKELYAKITREKGRGLKDPYKTALGHFNRLGERPDLDAPKVLKTYVFMTRPTLNLTKYNMRVVPELDYLRNTEAGKRALVNLLAPYDFNLGGDMLTDDYKIRSPFMPIITNLCEETSGGRDLVMDKDETKGDFSGNRLVYAKGGDESFVPGEVSLEMSDSIYSPVMTIAYGWFLYMHYITKGIIMPNLDSVQRRIIDYTSSIYIFIIGADGQTILRWGRYQGCFPLSVPFGNLQHSTNIDNQTITKISLPFAYNRYSPNSPKDLMDFNMISKRWGSFATRAYYKMALTTSGGINNRGNTISTNDRKGYYVRLNDTGARYGINPIQKAPQGVFKNENYPWEEYTKASAFTDDIKNPWIGHPLIMEGNKLVFV